MVGLRPQNNPEWMQRPADAEESFAGPSPFPSCFCPSLETPCLPVLWEVEGCVGELACHCLALSPEAKVGHLDLRTWVPAHLLRGHTAQGLSPHSENGAVCPPGAAHKGDNRPRPQWLAHGGRAPENWSLFGMKGDLTPLLSALVLCPRLMRMASISYWSSLVPILEGLREAE